MAEVTGAKAVAKTMKMHGVEYFFHVSGGMISLFIEIEEAGIDLVLTRSEKAAAYMADGYARVSYKPGICFGQAGPGAINLAAGIAEAHWTFTPVIAITGSTGMSDLYKFQYQELDEMPLFEPTTKWNAEIYQAQRAGEILRDAFNIALTGCPGPVHVNLHYDAANNKGGKLEPKKRYPSSYPNERTHPNVDDLRKAAELLVNAEQPVIVAGGGAIISQAWDEIVKLAEYLFLPVATTLSGKGTIPDEHPLSVGVVGRYSSALANKIVDEADVVLFIGSRLGGMATDNWSVPSQDSAIIQLDLRPEILGRNYYPAARLVCDAKLGIQDLLRLCHEMMKKPEKRKYLKTVSSLKRDWEHEVASVMDSDAVPIKPHRILKEIREILGKNDILVADTGQMGAWTGVLYPILASGRNYIRAAGTLGWIYQLH
jgi:acetolactate synthase-1/2/3 large subunit